MSEYQFGCWKFDSQSGILSSDSGSTRLRPQTATVLECLMENAPAIASRQELRERLWPDNTLVDFDTGINSCIKQIRHALGESAASPRYLHTVPKRGFRWSAESTDTCLATRKPRLSLPGRRALRAGLWIVALSIGVVIVLMSRWPTAVDTVPTVVVLPFESSATPGSMRLTSRIHTELIHALGDQRTLQVISRRSVLAKAESSLTIADMGAAFGARVLIDGSVREIADGYVVAISLVDGHSDAFIWGELVEIPIGDTDAGLEQLRSICVEAVAAFQQGVTENSQ